MQSHSMEMQRVAPLCVFPLLGGSSIGEFCERRSGLVTLFNPYGLLGCLTQRAGFVIGVTSPLHSHRSLGVTARMATIDLPLKSIHGLAQTDSGGGLPFVVAFDPC